MGGHWSDTNDNLQGKPQLISAVMIDPGHEVKTLTVTDLALQQTGVMKLESEKKTDTKIYTRNDKTVKGSDCVYFPITYVYVYCCCYYVCAFLNLFLYLLILQARQVPGVFQTHLSPFPVLEETGSYKETRRRNMLEKKISKTLTFCLTTQESLMVYNNVIVIVKRTPSSTAAPCVPFSNAMTRTDFMHACSQCNDFRWQRFFFCRLVSVGGQIKASCQS